MTFVLLLAAALGLAAVAVRLLRAAARLALSAARESATRGLTEVSARRGDLTGLEERSDLVRAARRERRRRGAFATLWVGILLLPLAVGPTVEVYAAYNAFWLLPRNLWGRLGRR
jgi:hypothetical protein